VAMLWKSQSGENLMKLYTYYKPLLADKEPTAPVKYLRREYFGSSLGSVQCGNNLLAYLIEAFSNE
ncbi:hypothetical protein OXX79_010897, partial [Metschnikowia pulcherrima]